MILQALYEYYQRKGKDLPQLGFERKEIPFLIVITDEGKFFDLEDTREQTGKKLTAKNYLVPKENGRSGSNAWQTTNLLWDHYGYVLGHPKSSNFKDVEMAKKQHQSFVAEVSKLCQAYYQDADIAAVLSFLLGNQFDAVFNHKNWADCLKIPGCNLSFKIKNRLHGLVCQNQSVQEYQSRISGVEEIEEDGSEAMTTQTVCLVSGDLSDIARLHPRTPIFGTKSNAKLVSFQKNMGFDSYGKEQNFNAPVGKRAAFAYTTALNHLLAKNSKQRLQVGDASTVFWAEKGNNALEDAFADFFSDDSGKLEAAVDSLMPSTKDDPDRNTLAVESLYQSPYTGSTAFDDDGTRFYVLGLAPNAARISVRFWHVATVGELAANIRQHFNDLAIVHESYEKPYLPLRRLLNSTAPATSKHPFGDPDRIAPNLAGDLMKSILAGTPYPQTLLQAALRRIRAEQARKDKTGKPLVNVTYERAGLIKAFLNRQIRFSNLPNKQELTMALDESNTNIGYRLGRLFATLEIIQQDAGGGLKKINATIRDRYYGAASSTPLAVFPTLLRLSQHHQTSLRKEKPGLFVERDKLLGRIMDDGINGQIGFPPVLSLENQGRFAIGYYQQRQAFFPNKHSLAT